MLSAQEEKTTSVKAAVEPAEDGHGKAASTASEEMAAGEETEVKSSEVTGVESAAYMPSYDEQQESKEEPKEQEQQKQGQQQQEQQEHAQQEQQQPQHIAGFYSYPQQLISQQLVPQQYAQQTSHSQAPFMVQSQAPVAAQANAPECGSASGRSSRAQNFIVDPAVDPFMYTQQRPDSASSNVLPFQQYQQQQFPYTMQYQQALYQPHHQHMQHFQILQPGMDLPMPLKSTDGVDGTVCNGTVSPTVAEQQYMQQLALQQQQLQLPPHVMHFPVSYDLSQFPGMVVPGMSMMQQPEYGASVVTERNTLEEGVQRSTNEMINVSGHDAGVQVIDSGSQSFNGDQHGNVSSTQPLAKSVTAKPTLKPRAALKRPRTKPQNWSKSQKPSMSSLLGRAIMAQPEQRARLSTIYNWIAEHFPEDYQLSVGGWQNSIRHNLTINHAFLRDPNKPIDGLGKGAYWSIHPDHLHEFVDGVFVGQTRGAEYRKKPKVKHESRASLGSTSSSKKSKKNAEQSFDFPAMGAEYGGLGAGSSSTEMNAFMPCDEVAAMQQQQQQQPTETPFPHTLDSNDVFEYQTHGPAQQQHQQLNDYAQPSAATAGATLTGFYPIMTNGTASAAASSFSIDSYGGFTHISNSPSVSPWPEATELAATATTMSVGDSASAAHSHEPTFLYAAGIANVDADLGKFDVATAEEKSGGLATTADTNGSC